MSKRLIFTGAALLLVGAGGPLRVSPWCGQALAQSSGSRGSGLSGQPDFGGKGPAGAGTGDTSSATHRETGAGAIPLGPAAVGQSAQPDVAAGSTPSNTAAASASAKPAKTGHHTGASTAASKPAKHSGKKVRP
jgi:hypothetical protein